ncbi:ComF family protein [Synechococcus sp. CBW1004]|uniref:ComF family protein n=1 Tax=Synechococcus sp. CBW1004 TaxID=1353136 RepID=UPI0018CFE3B4|nr:phosphoribosyltransferase family protein [Synechococcus sp. CBW1004]QPN63037.1 ComF family protein [Synechococcus sp. CBW1004]
MDGLCEACTTRLELPAAGLRGLAPLPWWSSGAYAGALRRTLLDQKCRRADAAVIRALLQPLLGALQEQPLSRHGPRAVLVVPIPGWKRRSNPLPGLIADQLARGLGLRRRDLLVRRHPVLGQHRLGIQLRRTNQEGSFQLGPASRGRRPAPVLLVDDILTTGSTLRHAALCLEQAGWPVLGAACLARTPSRRDWLRTP